MSKLFELSQGLWLEAQLAAPDFVQQAVIPRLHAAKEIARSLLKPHLPIYQWRGQGPAGPLSVAYVGLGFARPFLKSILFEEAPAEKLINRVSARSLRERLDALDGDLIVVETSRFVARRLPTRNAILLPLRLQNVIDVGQSWDDVLSRFRKTVHKNDLRRVLRLGYSYAISHDPADLARFYENMYVPTMKARHGRLASITSLDMMRRYLRHGFLLLIERDGRAVSAAVCSTQQRAVHLAISGVLGSDDDLRRDGAVAAIYYFLLHWANAQGFQSVDVGFCWPFLNDGIFQFKRKWGARALLPPRENKRLWVDVRRDTPAVRRFMRDNPCAAIDSHGQLYGLIVTGDAESASPEAQAEWAQRFATPGLSELRVRSIADLLPAAPDPMHTR
jgi:hypothetical protein